MPTGADSGLFSGRIPGVDGLRGIAILAVIVFHTQFFGISLGNSVWERVYERTAGLGWTGVDLFFVLSGFLITGILVQSREQAGYFRVFYTRRTLRIFPLYYLSLVLFFGIAPLVLKFMGHQDVILHVIRPASQVFAWSYTLNWRIAFASFSVIPVLIQPFWSLAIEEQFYLVWPLVVRKLANRGLMITCVSLIFVSLACRMAFQLMHMPDAAYVLTCCRLDSLSIGAIIALTIRNRRYWTMAGKAAPLLTVASGGLIALVASTGDISFHAFWMSTIGITLWGLFFGGCLVLTLTAREGTPVSRMTSWGALRFFGKYSYCLYVCHQPLIVALTRGGINSDSLTGIFHSRIVAVIALNCIVLLLAVVISLASWHLFEKHFLKIKDLSVLGRKAHTVRPSQLPGVPQLDPLSQG